MKKIYKIIIAICFVVFFSVKILDSTGTLDIVKLALSDKFNYKMEKLISQADNEDMEKILNSFLKKVHNDYSNNTIKETILLSANQNNKNVKYKFQMDYDDLLQSIQDRKKLSDKIKDFVYKDICSQGLLSFIVQNKNVSFEYIYYDTSLKERDRYLIQNTSCQEWENENKLFIFTKKIKRFFETDSE